LTDGFRLDHMYTSEKARDEERKGSVRRGAMAWIDEPGFKEGTYQEKNSTKEE
jgi:hypothetical protein